MSAQRTYVAFGGIPSWSTRPAENLLHVRKLQVPGIALAMLGHDAAAAAVRDGEVVLAVEEERLNRQKHFQGYPLLGLDACRRAVGPPEELVFYADLGDESLERRLAGAVAFADADQLAAIEKEYRHVSARVRGELERFGPPVRSIPHHLAHAASAYYPSGFDRALVLIADGLGEFGSTSVILGERERLRPIIQLPIASSLGALYARVTALLGFEPLEDEYKVMGLAAYGTDDEYRDAFDAIIRLDPNGAFSIPLLYQRDWKDRMERALGPPRVPGDPIADRHVAVACSLQRALERTVLRLLEYYRRELRTEFLCVAGGVGLNCSMNGAIDRSGLFEEMFVQPAASDPGAALGAALLAAYQDDPALPRKRLEHTFLGPSYSDDEVLRALESAADSVVWDRPRDIEATAADALARGEVLGWFQGRMEFGPRALGNRSILADPRRADMKDRVNRMVKKREEFRPFAPAVTAESASDFFELRTQRQYEFMTIAVRARPARAAEIPSVVHVDGSSRVQVVRRETNPAFWSLLRRFGEATGVPVLLNTSFNVKGEPIVCTPADAVGCLLGTELDGLAIQGYWVRRRAWMSR